MKDLLRRYYKKFFQKLNYDVHKNLMLTGKLLAKQNSQIKSASLDEVEFQVFSQRGEDGVIQYLISQIEIPNPIFVEFGVETYTESNTRFLLMNNNWSGLVLDGSKSNIDFIKQDFIYWKYDLVARQAFITTDNINAIISDYTKIEDIGLLSVDIDGNDYWVWESIECIKPRIVVCEYNSVFGGDLKLSIPYKADFVRSAAHYSELYFGASLAAFCHLADKKGYDFVGTTKAGVNAYFVRKDLSAPFATYSSLSGFNETANRDSKDRTGKLAFLRHGERLNEIAELPAVDVVSGASKRLAEWLS
ncbi:hypothetical protein [Flavobacterium selenitireducens]|uniref:hypothetical protein n=1 Tax=Flavobacterium selenitireducens TaxID=2722704 RepID=UPI00168B5A0D|nr:hypothetical protein [Flavobacterium selenitireducens]MBD3581587.1 hypothetical protein [Flavobacterium selenitireducens]